MKTHDPRAPIQVPRAEGDGLGEGNVIKAGCTDCNGTGHCEAGNIHPDAKLCQTCKGSGVIHLPQDQAAPCPICHGEKWRGDYDATACLRCAATGYVQSTPAEEKAAAAPQ
jgi:DnaJ-class molecular chaperone